MSGTVVGIGPTQQAELANVDGKRRSTLVARAMLILGKNVARLVEDDHEIFVIDGQRFDGIDAAEDYLDLVGGCE